MARFRLLPDEQQARSPLLLLWREFARQHSAMSGLVLFILFFLLALLSPLLTPHDPYLQNDALLLIAPSWSEQGLVQYPFGTDDLGRDMFSRLLIGARYTFGIAVITVLGALIMGLLLGTLAGMLLFRERLSRINLLAIPLAILAIALIAAGL